MSLPRINAPLLRSGGNRRLAGAAILFALAAGLLPLAPRAAGQATGAADVVGDWLVITYVGKSNHRDPITIRPDGQWTKEGKVIGKWEISGSGLVMHLNENKDWVHSYDLPAHDGLLTGHTETGGKETMTRRDPPGAESAAVLGPWQYFDKFDGNTESWNIHADGMLYISDKREGTWQVHGHQLVVYRDAHFNWHDEYPLPPADGTLRGTNGRHDELTLMRPGKTGTPARPATATAATISVAPSPPLATSRGSAPLPSASLQPFMDANLGKIFAPLGDAGFDKPEQIANLKITFADGLAAVPPERKAPYQTAIQLCDALSGVLNERQAAVNALSGATATHSSEVIQPKGGTAKAQAEIQHSDDFFTRTHKQDWLKHADDLRAKITALYFHEREQERLVPGAAR